MNALAAASVQFTTTHWSVVLQAGHGCSPAAQAALEQLCRSYWFPLYAYVRRKGPDEHEAQDLTQEFLTRLIERNDFARLDRAKGKFRCFLLASLNHFLANDWRHGRTLKRGGAVNFISMDAPEWEERWSAQAEDTLPLEYAYDRQWALAVLDQAMERVEREFAEAGKQDLFDALKKFLTEPTSDGGYEPAAQGLGLSPGAVRMTVLRLRRRFREVVRATVAETVTTPLELEEELRHLGRVLTE